MNTPKYHGGSGLINLFDEIVDAVLRLFGIRRTDKSLYEQAVAVISQVIVEKQELHQAAEKQQTETGTDALFRLGGIINAASNPLIPDSGLQSATKCTS